MDYLVDTRRLARAAKAAGYDLGDNGSATRLAKDAGVPYPTLSKVVRGIVRDPRGSTLLRLCGAMGCEPGALYSEQDPLGPR